MKSIRLVEAYVGEYASGKSEVAINRALEMLASDAEVTLVDLDLVEPCYTLRPIKSELVSRGLNVLAWDTRDTVGLGEAGNCLRADIPWALKRPGNIVFDVGYGAGGAKTLDLISGIEKEENLKIFAVINTSRPMTLTEEDVVQYVRELGPVHGLINNTHMGDETTVELVQAGARDVTAASRRVGIPVVATTAVAEVAANLGPADCEGNPVRVLQRFMPRAFW